ncbi:MAG: hypothetical protein ACRCTW_00170 [Lactococcus garvieae]
MVWIDHKKTPSFSYGRQFLIVVQSEVMAIELLQCDMGIKFVHSQSNNRKGPLKIDHYCKDCRKLDVKVGITSSCIFLGESKECSEGLLSGLENRPKQATKKTKTTKQIAKKNKKYINGDTLIERS